MIKKAKIDDKIVDVINFDEFAKNPSSFPTGHTAIECDGTVFPIRGKNDTRPGAYSNGFRTKFIKPSEEDKDIYSSANIIDFTNSKNIRDVINKTTQLRDMERVALTTVDNLFVPNVRDADAPEMVALKTAIIEKRMDIDKYEHRFESKTKFNNEKRLLNNDAITLTKLRSICNAIDVKATLILEDQHPDVPNPIGRQIIVEITAGGTGGNE